VSRYKNCNKKILKYNSNIYLANGVLLKDRFLSVLELMFKYFTLSQIYWYLRDTWILIVTTFLRVLY